MTLDVEALPQRTPTARIASLLADDLVWAIPLALVARIAFWIVTSRVWEDALITIAHARNAVEGLGLTHHPGEGVIHGFTSAISVLVPLVGEAVDPGSGLTALRTATLLSVVVALAAAERIGRQLAISVWPRRFILIYLALDPLQVFYGMAGMETQVAVAVLLLSLMLMLDRRPIACGVTLGLSVLVRPDFAIWSAIALAFVLLRSRQDAARAFLSAFITVAPWLTFATAYYGSPIPQTLIAKSISYTNDIGTDPAQWFLSQFASHVPTLGRTFAPFLENTLIQSAPMPVWVAAAISALCWSLLVLGSIAIARRVPFLPLFVAVYTAYRVFALPVEYFDWYVPPVAALSVIVIAAGVDRVATAVESRRAWALALSFAFAVPLVSTVGLEAAVQRDIEDAVRMQVGEYLRDEVPAGDPVAMEAAGYFGFYSRAIVYDYPGLTSRVALAAVRATPSGRRSAASMMARLAAPWIVVRPSEYEQLGEADPALAREYQLCRSFDAGTGPTISWGGLVLRTIDSRFEVRRLGPCP